MGPVSDHPRRPLLAADVERLAAAAPGQRVDLAYDTAAAVVAAGHDPAAPGRDVRLGRLVRLADEVGLDTLAALWRHAEPDSLPGALWTLYLLRAWCARCGADVARLYQAGRGLAPVDEVVAGLPDRAGPDEVADLADALLRGACGGNLGVALERAAALLRVVAAGRRQLAGDAAADQLALADRNAWRAEALRRAAAAWQAGRLR